MADAPCAVSAHRDALRARFDEPQWAPTPGQFLVIYDAEVCLGGGVIEATTATSAVENRAAVPAL
jgi:tRNA-specific 2-thiouridylase